MKTALDQLSTYAQYHRDRRNIATHLVGVPMIVLAVIVLLSRPGIDVAGMPITPAIVAVVVSGIYYLRLDLELGMTLVLIHAVMAVAGAVVAAEGTALWLTAGIGLFVVGWIIQFVGHYYEGRKPAFVNDVMGLVIGPLFVLAEVVFALGLRQRLLRDIEARVGPTLVRDMRADNA